MLRKGCWGDVHDFSNTRMASFPTSTLRHSPQHGRDPRQLCLDRSGFAAPFLQVYQSLCHYVARVMH